MYISESTNPVHSLSFRRASLRSELTFLRDRVEKIYTVTCLSSRSKSLISRLPLTDRVPKAASSVGQGGLPLQMARFAAFLSSVIPSLPARVGDHDLISKGMQGVIHNLHLHRVMG